MKRVLAILLSAVILSGILTGCGDTGKAGTETPAGPSASAPKEQTELKKIRVAAMPFFVSTPVWYIKENGLDKAAGLDMEIVLFSNGSTINEALAADQWDVAPTGGAAIFGVANYDAVYLADYVDCAGGDELYVRADDPAASIKGFNPTYPDILGDTDSVKGKTFLYTAGTSSQYVANQYLEALGVDKDAVSMIHMDFAQCYQGFLAGEGNFASLGAPYSLMAPDQGWVKAADLKSLSLDNLATVIASRKAYENMRPEIEAFLNILYDANETLESDPELKYRYVASWLAENGSEVDEETVRTECGLKFFLTREAAKALEFGGYIKDYATFLASIDMLEVEKIDTVVNNSKDDFLAAVLG